MNASDSAAKKSLGQHFLQDGRAIARIVSLLPAGCRALEIGPGPGALTLPLLRRCSRLVVIEKDDRFAAHWHEVAQRDASLEVVHADVMDALAPTISKHQPQWIVGNLPYNISGPLTAMLASFRVEGGMALMYQREVAERICALPGSRTYGGLSVLVRHHYIPKIVLRLPPGAFAPPPKVHSSVVQLLPHRYAEACSFAALSRAVRIGFAHRRKTLRNNFKGILDAATLAEIGIDAGLRPEQLDYAAWARIARHIEAANGP